MLAKFLGLIGLALVTLTACGSNSASVSALLPLSQEDPTFVFFFTDG